VCGLEQEAQLPPSIRQVKVEGDWLELNVNVGVSSFEGFAGLESIVVSGIVVSVVHVYVAGDASVFPAWSVARTSKVWLPSASDGSVCGLVQDAQLPPSTRHANVEPASLELKLNVGVSSLDGSGGFESIVVCGGVLSMRRLEMTTGAVSSLPATSVATERRS
jgi:hypothetical protein